MDFDEAAAADSGRAEGGDRRGGSGARSVERSPLSKPRSMSDGGGTPGKLSPSPHMAEASRRTARDDSSLGESALSASLPVTPRRPDFSLRGLALQMPPRDSPPPPAAVHGRPAPLSPKLDHSHIYASPTNILPRRSRGLDFSRAATSLHHSMLAEQSSPDSSPTMGGRAMNIPNRALGDHGAPELSNSLWSIMGNQERMNISSSLGSNLNQACCSDSSSGSGDDDFMDEDMDEAYVTTPQITKAATPTHSHAAGAWAMTSPAANSLLSFQQRQRPRKPPKRRLRGPLGFTSIIQSTANLVSKSPPGNNVLKEAPPLPHSRRESISWAANQLHISGSESDDSPRPLMEGGDGSAGTAGREGQRGVIRRVVTRRGDLLPKTKGFARIRAALAEESTPVEAEVRREAEVVRQVRDSDMDLESLVVPPAPSAPTTAHSSPNLPVHDNMDETSEDAMIMDGGLGLSSSFKQQMLRHSKGRNFWETFPDAPGGRITPPPPTFYLPRGPAGGIGPLDDMAMDSPSAAYASQSLVPAGGVFPMTTTTTSSSGGGTPAAASASTGPPSAAEITRRINSKRRRDDDFDPVSFKRRAVSPGMSVHNSPIMQSPLQRDMAPWGSRPGSNGGDRAGGGGSGGSGAPSESGGQSQGPPGSSQGRVNGGKGRIGFQGMVDTHDGITRLSIE